MIARSVSYVTLLARMFVIGVCSLILIAPAHAGPLEEAIAKFSADDYSQTAEAITLVATSGARQSADILDALANRRLAAVAARKTVFFSDTSGSVFDALTGEPVAAVPTDAVTVRVNNRLRGMIDGAIGTLTLRAPDMAKRLSAADAIFKSRDAKSLPGLNAALAGETDPRVRGAMQAARAAVILGQTDAAVPDQVAAIKLLVERGSADAIGLIGGVAVQSVNLEVKAAASAALAAMQRKQQATALVQNVWYGLSLGSVLLLASAGLAITFGVMGVINMAHGEMVMIGAYTTYVVQEVFRAIAPGALDYALIAAIPTAFLTVGLIGVLIERGIIRFLYGRPLETLLATWGVSLILQQGVRAWFGASNVAVSAPSYMSGSFEFMGVVVTYGRLWIIVFTLLAFAALQLVIRRTALGLNMRAVTQNRRMASAMGIPTGRVDALTFGLGSGIAGVAGVALSQIDNVAPNLGQSYIIDCFMVVVFGGVGSLWGTLVSAFTLGVANKLLEPLAGAVLAKILILILLILFIQKRPRGLFALKGRAVDV
jgi:urea transport system permease protein